MTIELIAVPPVAAFRVVERQLDEITRKFGGYAGGS
jgi:hypothetical protein